VANRTASTPHLIEAVDRRAKASRCDFALLIPDVSNRKAADWTLETAQRSLRPAARGNVEGIVGGSDPFESVKQAVRDGNFDEIIISTLSKKTSKWLRRDLIRRVETLGLPVTAIHPPNFKEDLRTLKSPWEGRGGPDGQLARGPAAKPRCCPRRAVVRPTGPRPLVAQIALRPRRSAGGRRNQ